MGHAPKLEPPVDDESKSELNDALDLLIAEFADRRGLDEEAGPYDDGPDDTGKTMDEHLSRLVQETETVDSDTLLATSRMKAYPFDKTRWTQRVLSWIRRELYWLRTPH